MGDTWEGVWWWAGGGREKRAVLGSSVNRNLSMGGKGEGEGAPSIRRIANRRLATHRQSPTHDASLSTHDASPIADSRLTTHDATHRPTTRHAGKGGKNRRRGKNDSEEKRELIFKEDGQEYAQVLRMLGTGRLEAYCIDGVKRLCHIRGKMRKKVWVNTGDIVLLGLREYQDEKADVILKYMADEARSLKQYGELPDNIRVNDTDALMDDEVDGEEDLVDFEDVDDI